MKFNAITAASLTVINFCSIQHGFAGTEAPPPNTTATTITKSFLENLSEYGTLSYFGTYRGASITNFGSSLQPRPDGSQDPTNPNSFESTITAGYKINKDLITGVVGHFYLFPWNDPTGGNQKIQLLDPILFLSRPGLINSQGFRLDTRVTLQLPTSKYDILLSRHLTTAITWIFNARYETLASKLTVGTYGFIRGYIPSYDTLSKAPSYTVTAAPYANYQLSDNLAASLWIDLLGATRNYGTGFFSGLQTSAVDIEPGIIWDITKNISLNPMLNIYPGSPTLASTSIQANIIAKAF